MASDTSLVFNLIARDRLSGTLDQTQSRIGRMRDSLSGLVGPALAFGAANMLGGFVKDAYESQKIGKLTENTIKSMGASSWTSATQVADLAEAISNKTGADDEAVQSGANLLLTFGNIRNEAGKGNDIFNQTTQAATDMAAAMNDGAVTQEGVKSASMMLGKALNDPITGMGKLTKSGVSFTEQQKEQVKALVKSGDTLGAQKIILDEVGKQFGGAAEAAATPLDKLKTKFGNVGEEIGAKLIPYVEKGLDVITKIVDYVTANSSWLLPLVGGLAALLGVIKLITGAMRIWTTVTAIFNAVMAMNPVVLITLAVIALIAVIVLIATKTTWFQTIWKTVWGAIKTAFWAVINWIKNTALSVWNFIKDKFKAAMDFVSSKVTWIKDKFVAFYNRLRSIFQTAKDWIVSRIRGAFDWVSSKVAWIRDKFVAFGTRVRSTIQGVKDNIVNKFRAGFDWVKGKIDTVVGWFRALPGRVTSAVSGLFNGIKNAFKSAINWVIGKWNGLSFTLPSISVFGKKIGGGTISTPNLPMLAKGGTITGGGSVIVGERGPEMLTLPKGAQVDPKIDRGGGAAHVTIEFKKTGNGLMDKFLDELQDAIRVRGGNVQAVIGTR